MGSTIQKNRITWDLVLFFALYIIMPEYCAIELSAKLPLITVSRMVLVLTGIMLVIRRRCDLFDLRRMNVKNLNLLLTKDPVLRWGMMIYFVLLLVTNLSFLSDLATEAVKDMFSLITEQYAMVWLLTLAVDTRQKLVQCLKVLVYASGIAALVTVFGVVVDCNLFHFLKTTQRDMLMASYYRLGMLRAEAGFGHPVFYGAFCAVILPVNMYLMEQSSKRWERLAFCGCMVLNLMGLTLSNSRGSQIAFLCLIVLMLPFKLWMRSGRNVVRNYLGVIAATVVMLCAVTAAAPAGTEFLNNMAESLMQVIIPEQTNPSLERPPEDATGVPETPPAVTEPGTEYGENAEGLLSRMVQLSGIQWTLEHKPVFGFGPGAQNRYEIYYEFAEGRWWATGTVDVGIVSVIAQYGIVGMVGYLALYLSVLITLLRKKMWEDKLMMTFFFCFASIILCLLSVAEMDKTMWVLIGLFVCLVNTGNKKERINEGEK